MVFQSRFPCVTKVTSFLKAEQQQYIVNQKYPVGCGANQLTTSVVVPNIPG